MAAASESPQNTRRIVLLGKTGVGKSSLANTIFGEDVFTVVCSPNAETKNCQAETRSVNERNITLIDTPGLLDLDRREEEQRTELLRCITEFGPGLHAFLIVFKMEKFNSVVNDISRKICEYFPDEVFKYAAVVFTHGEQLHDGMTIEKSVRQNTYMRDLVQKCGNRCHIVDNVRWNSTAGGYRSNQVQVAKLLNTIDNIVKGNNGGCYKGDTRIVLLGKTRVGKSSLANTIFGEDVFTVVCSPNAETKNCQAETRSVNERNITLIDTPGLLDLDRREEEQRTELLRCTAEFGPGLHAFLIVFKMENFNSVVNDISRKICEYFPDEVFKYAAVVFTHGEQLRDGMTIEKSVRQNTYMRDLVQKCGNRCHIVDNVRWNSTAGGYRSNQVQVAKLLNTIDNIVKGNNGGCYKGDRRIVLLGKTGVGKSSTSNTIFGETVFETDDSPNAGTSECANVTRSVNGIITTLIDTPGFFDLGMSKKKLRDEMAKCITQCAPGPHVFLILLKVEKHIPHKVIDKIQEVFSEEVFKYVAVVFTHGDQLPKEMEIEAFVQENEGLSDLVRKCGSRCHVIDNKYWENNEQGVYRSNQFQVAKLLKTIDNIVKENKRGYYTHNRMNKKNGWSCNLI